MRISPCYTEPYNKFIESSPPTFCGYGELSILLSTGLSPRGALITQLNVTLLIILATVSLYVE